MKDRLTVFHLQLESRAVRKIRLRYSESTFHAPIYHMSQNVTFSFILTVHAVLKFSTENPRTPMAAHRYVRRYNKYTIHYILKERYIFGMPTPKVQLA